VNFQSTLNQKDANACIVVAMSHGMDREFELTSGVRVNFWERVIYKFSIENCPDMSGKPKLFFVNTCQDFAKFPTTHREREHLLGQDFSDILVVHSALPGFPSHRHKISGSLFIRALVEVFMKHACETELQKMLRLVSCSHSRWNIF